jgi:hypothetical protein
MSIHPDPAATIGTISIAYIDLVGAFAQDLSRTERRDEEVHCLLTVLADRTCFQSLFILKKGNFPVSIEEIASFRERVLTGSIPVFVQDS